MKRAAHATALLLCAIVTGAAAPQVQPKTTKVQVAGPIYLLHGDGGGNVAVVADPSGLFMVDAMEESVAGQIRDLLKSFPGSGRVRILVNTHWHGDHTDGNKAFGAGAAIIAHENVRRLVAAEQTLLGQVLKALPPTALPNITYADRLTVYAGGETIRLVHYPRAHTDGDTVVFWDKHKVVHMGDMFFNGMFPFMDVANGGDIQNWIKQLDAILADLPADTKIIPGHGQLAGPAELKAFRQMLADSAAVVRKQMQEGKTLEQIKAAGLPKSFDPWTQGFLTTPRWLELVYRSLEKQQ
jgi:cyclase